MYFIFLNLTSYFLLIRPTKKLVCPTNYFLFFKQSFLLPPSFVWVVEAHWSKESAANKDVKYQLVSNWAVLYSHLPAENRIIYKCQHKKPMQSATVHTLQKCGLFTLYNNMREGRKRGRRERKRGRDSTFHKRSSSYTLLGIRVLAGKVTPFCKRKKPIILWHSNI